MMYTNDNADVFPLLALKIAPRQFDLSYRFSNISLRDQIVRAQILIQALHQNYFSKVSLPYRDDSFDVLIIGAGAAGLAAANEADELGLKFVLIEKEKQVPGGVLRKNANRYVSTGMYEWPNPNAEEHSYPLLKPRLLGTSAEGSGLKLTFKTPVRVKEFGDEIENVLSVKLKNWTQNYRKYDANPSHGAKQLLIKPATLSRHSKGLLTQMLDKTRPLHSQNLHEAALPAVTVEITNPPSSLKKLRFQFIIYAVGFGTETRNYSGRQRPYRGFVNFSFWDRDNIPSVYCGLRKPPRIGILGSGDGALQDAIRSLISPGFGPPLDGSLVSLGFSNPLDIWNYILDFKQPRGARLRDSTNISTALTRISSADVYSTTGAIWSPNPAIFESLDIVFKDVVRQLVAAEGSKLHNAIVSIIRNDIESLTLITDKGFFTKVYALNRFLVHLLYEVLKLPRATSSKKKYPSFEILHGQVTSFKKLPKSTNTHGALVGLNSLMATPVSLTFDLAIIRGGIDKRTVPNQRIGLSGKDVGRTALGRIPVPIRPVDL